MPTKVRRRGHAIQRNGYDDVVMDVGEFYPGDEVLITRGTFDGFKGTVRPLDSDTYPRKPGDLVSVMLTIFGRMTPVDVPVEDLKLA